MKLIITGGTGFIGTPLCQALAEEGHDLVLLTRAPSRTVAAAGPRVRLVGWQPGSVGEWATHVDGADGVINLAGESIAGRRWTASQKARLCDSRLQATASVVTAIGRATRKPAVLVSASAVGYYGPHGDEPLDEESASGTDFLAGLCRQWEETAHRAEQFGARVVLLRIGIVLAPGGGALAKMLPPFRLGIGGPIGDGRQWCSWVHRDDVIGLIRHALITHALRGPVNATAPEPVTMRQFAEALGRAVHRPSWLPVPAAALRVLLGEMAEVLLTGQRVLPVAARRSAYAFRHETLEYALAAALSSR